jgi:hypothetical protein
MHHVAMNLEARYLGIVFLAAVIVAIAVLCWQAIRHGGRPWLTGILGGYSILLVVLFIVGLLSDDGYGWAFLPLMILTAPWSFMVSMVPRGFVMDWFASGWFGNFVLFVVLCGGVNDLLLYAVVGRVFYPPAPRPLSQSLLSSRSE